MSSRDRNLFIGLGVLIIVLSVVSDVLGGNSEGDYLPSSYATSEGGAAALYLTLEELSIPVERRLTPFDDGVWPTEGLVMLGPTQSPRPAELHALADWIRGGGTLFYAGRRNDSLLDSLGITIRPPQSDGEEEEVAEDEVEGIPAAHRLTRESGPVGSFRWVFDEEGMEGTEPLLVTAEGEAVAVYAPLGRGQVIAFSDFLPFVNGSVEESGAAPIFVRALSAGGGRVAFDEYHHGFRENGSVVAATFRFLTGTAPGWASLQIGVAALGLLVMTGVRFGSPLPAPPAQRRDPLEHVEALAEAYRRANARRSARQLMLTGLARRLGRTPSEADGERLFEALGRSAPSNARGHVTALESEWERGDAADLVALARHMDAIVKESRRG